jgi:hypothetical protein
MSTTVGSVAGSAVSTLLSPITFFLSSVSTLSSAADQGLRRLSAAVPDAVDQAAVDIGLAVDANARRKVELWNVHIIFIILYANSIVVRFSTAYFSIHSIGIFHSGVARREC